MTATLTVDQLGTIALSNIVDYHITIDSHRYDPMVYTPANTTLSIDAPFTITADHTELEFLFDVVGSEGILFLSRNSDNVPGWIVGGGKFGSFPFFLFQTLRNGEESDVDFASLRREDESSLAVTFDIVPLPAGLPFLGSRLLGLGIPRARSTSTREEIAR